MPRAIASSVSLVLDESGHGDAYGAAIVLNDQGYLVTAQHVIDGAHGITVLMPGGRAAAARVVAEDPVGDIALLQTKFIPGVMQPATVAAAPVVGDTIFSVGNPFGTARLGGAPSVSSGVVSAVERSFLNEKTGRIYLRCLQHDAPTNPGNSGGGVFNARGELVAMNVLINTPQDTPSESGVAFALPADALIAAAQTMLAGTKITHGWLGERGYRSVLWLGQDGAGTLGFMLREIEDASPGYQAGIQAGDVVVSILCAGASFNAHANQRQDLLAFEDKMKPGESAKVVISRAGRELDFTITVGNRPLKR